MKKKKINLLVDEGYNNDYERFLKGLFDIESTTTFDDIVKKGRSTNNINFILYTGGEDVYPAYYRENVGSRTHFNESRDKNADLIFRLFRANNIPKLGICRGLR